ncbi:MAG TPA: antitoxin MazE family protein [Acidimicrobiales bacterium]|nr:antitoxin MazE family protein [Acidimicrobiales bacterium]
MARQSETTPVRARVRAHRARLRAEGLRPVQIWVPDVRSPQFATEAHRQSAILASSSRALEDQEFIEAISAEEE